MTLAVPSVAPLHHGTITQPDRHALCSKLTPTSATATVSHVHLPPSLPGILKRRRLVKAGERATHAGPRVAIHTSPPRSDQVFVLTTVSRHELDMHARTHGNTAQRSVIHHPRLPTASHCLPSTVRAHTSIHSCWVTVSIGVQLQTRHCTLLLHTELIAMLPAACGVDACACCCCGS